MLPPLLEDIFEVLHSANRASEIVDDLRGRTVTCTVGHVVDNLDPDKEGKVKVSTDAKGHTQPSDWLVRILPAPYEDPPVVQVGQLVIVFFIDGDQTDGVYLGVPLNALNNPLGKENAILDSASYVPGKRLETTVGNQDEIIGGARNTSVTGDITSITSGSTQIASGLNTELSNSGGAVLTQSPDGTTTVTIPNNGVARFVLKVGDTTIMRTTPSGDVDFTPIGTFKVHGRAVAVIGGRTSNSIITSSGQS